MGTSIIMPCYNGERLKTKTHVVRSREVNRIQQAQGEPSGPFVAWVSSRIVYIWCPYNMDCQSEGGT